MPRPWETWGTRCSVLQLPSSEVACAPEELEQSMLRESRKTQEKPSPTPEEESTEATLCWRRESEGKLS